METEKIGNKGLLWYIENNKTTIKEFPALSTEEIMKRLFDQLCPLSTPKIPKRVPKRKK